MVNKMKKYLTRLIEKKIERKLKTSGAVFVAGPKYSGKTTTCMLFQKSNQLRNDLLSVKDDSIKRNYNVGCTSLYSYRYTLGYLVEDGEGSSLVFLFHSPADCHFSHRPIEPFHDECKKRNLYLWNLKCTWLFKEGVMQDTGCQFPLHHLSSVPLSLHRHRNRMHHSQ